MWFIISVAVLRNNIKSRERYLWNVLAGIAGILLTWVADSWAYNVLDRNPDLDDDGVNTTLEADDGVNTTLEADDGVNTTLEADESSGKRGGGDDNGDDKTTATVCESDGVQNVVVEAVVDHSIV